MADRRFIEQLLVSNFKFFPALGDNSKPLQIDGKHLLVFGENGAGKSSIFWSLYTLLECANKTSTSEITKYFDYTNKQNLLNIYASPGEDGKSVENAFVKLKFTGDANDDYKISYSDFSINTKENVKVSNYASDFINYRFVYSAFNFRHRDRIDLYENFEYNVFPYIKFEATRINKFNQATNRWAEVVTENANEILDFLQFGPKFTKVGTKKEYTTTKAAKVAHQNVVDKALVELKKWEAHINSRGNEILQKELGYPKIGFKLDIELEKTFHLTKRNYSAPVFKIWLSVPKYDTKEDKVHRLHSFLNEAKLTAISLAIRFAILEKRPSNAELKVLVLDDMMISLDMNNRERVLKFVFEKYLPNYQVFILTHDLTFFEFTKLIIKQNSKMEDWKISEMYVGNKAGIEYEFPIILEAENSHLEKARKYFNSKDYTACALYLRKEIESMVYARLPNEYIEASDGQFRTLSTLWAKCADRYAALGKPFTEKVKNYFTQTRILVLNPQAHHNLTMPVYKEEIEGAFSFIEEFKRDFPIPVVQLILKKGTVLRFKHPSENYSIEFELNSDFETGGFDGAVKLHIPNCKILSWQYNNTEYYDFDKKKPIVLAKPIEDGLSKIKKRLTDNSIIPLSITSDMFEENTMIKDTVWNLKELLLKCKITI